MSIRNATDVARVILSRTSKNVLDDGRRVVELLLSGRTAKELTSEELELLAKGYNWSGNHDQALATARLQLTRTPELEELWELVSVYTYCAYSQNLTAYLYACDSYIGKGHGPAAFWYLRKADQLITYATGERDIEDLEWSTGDPIPYPDYLAQAADELQKALQSWPGLLQDESARSWIKDWNTRFAAVLTQTEYKHLSIEI